METVIVKKFIGALQHFEKRELTLIGRGNPWPDFEAQEGNRRVGIEIVEVVNIDHVKKRALQRQYEERLTAAIQSFSGELSGLKIQVDDGQQEPVYPSYAPPRTGEPSPKMHRRGARHHGRRARV